MTEELTERLLLEAISFAARAHRDQLRKDNRTPYTAHAMRVMFILRNRFKVTDAATLAAGVLHDTIEDTTTDRDDLDELFGEQVGAYVTRLSKDKRLQEEQREKEYFAGLCSAPVPVKLCKLADTLDNLLDSTHLRPASRRKAVSKARLLVEEFTRGFPPEWTHALDELRTEIVAVEAELPPSNEISPA